jgi:hypothetical protein
MILKIQIQGAQSSDISIVYGYLADRVGEFA